MRAYRPTQGRRWNPFEFPPPSPQGWKVYYELDPDDLPSIKAIATAWKQGVKARDASFHGHYSLKTILREVRPGNFLRVSRSGHASEREEWAKFVEDIRGSGVLAPVTIDIDKTGEVRIGEGNHRMAALLEIHKPYQRDNVMVPVLFYFREKKMSPQWAGLTWATFTRPEMFSRVGREEAAPKRGSRKVSALKRRQEEMERKAKAIAARSQVETPEEREQMEELLKLLF